MGIFEDEAARAAEHRALQVRRAEARKAQYLALAGDPEAAAALKAGWQPIIDAQLDPEGTLGRGRSPRGVPGRASPEPNDGPVDARMAGRPYPSLRARRRM